MRLAAYDRATRHRACSQHQCRGCLRPGRVVMYAVGDAVRGPMLANKASEEGHMVAMCG